MAVGEEFEDKVTNKWKLKLDWQLENQILGELIWTQGFAPDSDASVLQDGAQINIISFFLVTCKEVSTAEDQKLDISYLEEWRNCRSGQNREAIVTPDDSVEFLTQFQGLKIKRDTTNDEIVQFPVMETEIDNAFFSFGLDWMHRGYLFPAFMIPSTGEHEYALQIRLSVFDTRTDPIFDLWSEWAGCDGVCGADKVKTRYRTCTCSTASCFPCDGNILPNNIEEEEGVCDLLPCEFGDYSDFGNCVYHSACCQTVQVTGNGQDGLYSKLYVENEPFVVYKKVGTHMYIHYSHRLTQWVISDSYWEDLTDANIVNKATGVSASTKCPSEMADWTDGAGDVAVVIVSCDDVFGQRCPDTHPFAYDDGANCCAAPFEDVNDEFGAFCDGSPISLQSRCCLNSFDQTNETTPCTVAGPNCSNNINAPTLDETFVFLKDTELFYKYSHRGCLGANTEECGESKDLTKYEICPNWLQWETWSDCYIYARIETPEEKDLELFYDQYQRKRVRNCNTGNMTECLTEPRLSDITEESNVCGKYFFSSTKN